MIRFIENMKMASITVKSLIIMCLICTYGLQCIAAESFDLHSRVIRSRFRPRTKLTSAPLRDCPPGYSWAKGICRRIY
ncbi:hypothetical protein J437_LFUL001511 [Ladona fulva]|uniref:Uncharacterized protein n=1 Tax=Ladona fulva TaxID=123851 RepID=A0A8K0NT77_LADFU|nr:hypothetical protein J437_LFUL001511 [Ladona fulva]